MLRRSTVLLFGLFIVWAATIALRVILTRPYEFGWFIGLVAAAASPFAAGYLWHAIRPARKARRPRRG